MFLLKQLFCSILNVFDFLGYKLKQFNKDLDLDVVISKYEENSSAEIKQHLNSLDEITSEHLKIKDDIIQEENSLNKKVNLLREFNYLKDTDQDTQDFIKQNGFNELSCIQESNFQIEYIKALKQNEELLDKYISEYRLLIQQTQFTVKSNISSLKIAKTQNSLNNLKLKDLSSINSSFDLKGILDVVQEKSRLIKAKEINKEFFNPVDATSSVPSTVPSEELKKLLA